MDGAAPHQRRSPVMTLCARSQLQPVVGKLDPVNKRWTPRARKAERRCCGHCTLQTAESSVARQMRRFGATAGA